MVAVCARETYRGLATVECHDRAEELEGGEGEGSGAKGDGLDKFLGA